MTTRSDEELIEQYIEDNIRSDGKICATCQTWKPFGSFGRSISTKAGYKSNCKLCRKTYEHIWRKSNKAKNAKTQRSWHLRNSYDITQEEYDEVLKSQEGRCFFNSCGGRHTLPKTHTHFYVHHIHGTSKKVCLLCNTCNSIWREGVIPTQLRAIADFMEITGYDK